MDFAFNLLDISVSILLRLLFEFVKRLIILLFNLHFDLGKYNLVVILGTSYLLLQFPALVTPLEQLKLSDNLLVENGLFAEKALFNFIQTDIPNCQFFLGLLLLFVESCFNLRFHFEHLFFIVSVEVKDLVPVVKHLFH